MSSAGYFTVGAMLVIFGFIFLIGALLDKTHKRNRKVRGFRPYYISGTLAMVVVGFVFIFIAGLKGIDEDKAADERAAQEQQLQQQQEAADKQTTEALKQYMYENFGGNGNKQYITSWYPAIVDMKVKTNSKNEKYVDVATALSHDDAEKLIANDIIGAIFGYFNSSESKVRISSVSIYGKDGSNVVTKYNPIKW